MPIHGPPLSGPGSIVIPVMYGEWLALWVVSAIGIMSRLCAGSSLALVAIIVTP
jgi:hypothetical protein